MAGSIFDQLREAAKKTAEELDLKNRVEQGLNTAGKAVNDAASAAREQFGKLDEQFKVTESVREGATKAEETIRGGAEEFSKAAGETAREVFGTAEGYYRRAEQVYSAGASGARLTEAALSGYQKAREWISANPGKTAIVSLSMIYGIRAGSALPKLSATVLGAGGLFHSALPIVGMRKLTERYDEYLKEQERLLAEGKLDEAERGRVEFQRNLTKYVGAPLLGAFSVAAGASMIGAAFSGATVTSLPLTLILGGNPLLNGVWFFANGVVCISEGYKFFMIALADQEEVERVVREIKGLLPA